VPLLDQKAKTIAMKCKARTLVGAHAHCTPVRMCVPR